jgi:hypothetical protein
MPNSNFEFFGPNAGAGSTTEIRNKNKLVNQEVDAVGSGNPGKVMELVSEASTIAGAVGSVDSIHEAFKNVDERWNPQMYAQRSVDAMALNNLDITGPAMSLNSFDIGVVQDSTVTNRTKPPENPTAVKAAGRELLAGKHVSNMGNDIDFIDVDRYINDNKLTPNGVATNPNNVRIDASLEQQIRTKAEAKRLERVAQISADLQSGKMKIADVESIISNPAVNGQIKSELTKLIEPATKEALVKNSSTAEALLVKNETVDQIYARTKTSTGYLNASPEVKAAIDAQIEVNKKERSIASDLENNQKDSLDNKKRENFNKYFTSLSKEVVARIRVAFKAGVPLAILFAIGGPMLLAGSGLAFAGSGLALAGVGAGIGGLGGLALSGYNAEVIKNEKERLKAQKARKEEESGDAKLVASNMKRRLEEKKKAIEQSAEVFALSKGFNVDLVKKEMMKGTNMDEADSLIKTFS